MRAYITPSQRRVAAESIDDEHTGAQAQSVVTQRVERRVVGSDRESSLFAAVLWCAEESFVLCIW